MSRPRALLATAFACLAVTTALSPGAAEASAHKAAAPLTISILQPVPGQAYIDGTQTGEGPTETPVIAGRLGLVAMPNCTSFHCAALSWIVHPELTGADTYLKQRDAAAGFDFSATPGLYDLTAIAVDRDGHVALRSIRVLGIPDGGTITRRID